ncbi:hypothetical protein HY636_03075 [Candidatus Woesearchaeota archaeon]|nr:hypothetical protein [Candidatus Woesearchaeota archaeon]
MSDTKNLDLILLYDKKLSDEDIAKARAKVDEAEKRLNEANPYLKIKYDIMTEASVMCPHSYLGDKKEWFKNFVAGCNKEFATSVRHMFGLNKYFSAIASRQEFKWLYFTEFGFTVEDTRGITLKRGDNRALIDYELVEYRDAKDGPAPDINFVIAHEIGHMLNLDHNNDSNYCCRREGYLMGMYGFRLDENEKKRIDSYFSRRRTLSTYFKEVMKCVVEYKNFRHFSP